MHAMEDRAMVAGSQANTSIRIHVFNLNFNKLNVEPRVDNWITIRASPAYWKFESLVW